MKTHAKLRDMRSTALLVLGTANEAWIGHVGDSRAYLVREGRAERLTRDDTLVQSLVDLGQLSDEAAKTHSKANVLMQSVGDPKALEYHVRGPIEVRANDRIIACSDGLWEVMTDADLATQASQGDPDEVAARLVKLALASNASDNVTVGVMHWRASGARPLTAKHRIVLPAAAAKRSPTKKRRSARVEVLVLLSLLAIVAGAFLARMYRDRHAARPVPADISR
jgi:protein phosphatase